MASWREPNRGRDGARLFLVYPALRPLAKRPARNPPDRPAGCTLSARLCGRRHPNLTSWSLGEPVPLSGRARSPPSLPLPDGPANAPPTERTATDHRPSTIPERPPPHEHDARPRPTYKVTELLGDGIGAELSRPSIAWPTPCRSTWSSSRVDLSLENRRARKSKRFTTRRSQSINATGRAEVPDDHGRGEPQPGPPPAAGPLGDPPAGDTIPGVPTNFRRELDLDIVRIATGGTYDDPGRMIGEDGAVSLRIVERRPVARGGPLRLQPRPARPASASPAPRSTRSRRRPTASSSGSPTRWPASSPRSRTTSSCSTPCSARSSWPPRSSRSCSCSNEYGDFLSDMACGLAGSLGIGASANLGFDAVGRGPRRAVRRRARHRAGHRRQEPGQPDGHLPRVGPAALPDRRDQRRHAVKNATLDLLRQGTRTRDLGGRESTDSFTEAVAAEVSRRLIPAASPTPATPGRP